VQIVAQAGISLSLCFGVSSGECAVDVAGTNTLTFSTKGLKPGTYQLVATPRSSSGKAGRAITITFHVK
jgi:hypothetical protein